ncbi:MAG TPA: protein kinase [Polyangiaceae bacterium]|nr:protein kinase [Polyangiaceae bacterium]
MQPLDPRLVALRDWLPGQVLRGTGGGQYHLRERVGEGGQGWVFSASWDDPGGYVVIVKVLRPDAVTPESLVRFEREAQVLRMLGQATRPNPHVVRFFDHATARLCPPSRAEPIDLPFTVLEYVRGPTLERILERSRGVGLALDRTRRIARQVVLALEDVHAHKVVHRDLKPSNVLLASEGEAEVAKVTDFGLVKLIDVGLGRTTALAGATLGYAPPEQFEQGNRRVSPRTDVFSFAAMLYEMLTGVKAFPHGDGENPLVVVTRLLNGARPSLLGTRGVLPRELAMRPDLVERIDALILRATAAEPGERHASIGALWGAIEPLLREASSRPSPPHGIAVTAIDLPTPPPGASRPGWVAPPLRESLGSKGRPPMTPAGPELARAPSAAWTWRVRVPPVGPDSVRAAVFDAGGDMAVAVGATGLLVWETSGWKRSPVASEIDARQMRGLAWLRPGELIAFGTRGLAARLVPGGGLESWPLPDTDMTFRGAHVDPPGTTVTLVGDRPARRAARGGSQGLRMTGVIAQFARGRLALLSDVPECARLRAVTRLRAGEIVGCGDSGALVRVELGVAEHLGSICGGHLHSIAALDDGAITVGAGGHALSLSSRLQGQLEAVQTTRDLLALAVDARGVAWAGSAQARLLRRTAGSWVRMSAELGLSSSVVALWAAPRSVRAICDDGAVIEGIMADDYVDR